MSEMIMTAVIINYATRDGRSPEPGIAPSPDSVFAVHRGIDTGEYIGWVVSHIAVGLRVPDLKYMSISGALRAAEAFNEIAEFKNIQPDPDDPLGVLGGLSDDAKLAGRALTNRLLDESSDLFPTYAAA